MNLDLEEVFGGQSISSPPTVMKLPLNEPEVCFGMVSDTLAGLITTGIILINVASVLLRRYPRRCHIYPEPLFQCIWTIHTAQRENPVNRQGTNICTFAGLQLCHGDH
jgi:hypothetical protein